MYNNMKILTRDVYSDILKHLDHQQIQNMCKSDKSILKYCKANRNSILKNIDTPNMSSYNKLSFLFKNKDEMLPIVFDKHSKDLLEELKDEYPINQNDNFLREFGHYVAKNWKKYIKLDAELTILWIAHTIESSPSKKMLHDIYTDTPTKVIKEIKKDRDFLNTDNPGHIEMFIYFLEHA